MRERGRLPPVRQNAMSTRTPEPSAMFTTRDLVITDPPGPHLQSR